MDKAFFCLILLAACGPKKQDEHILSRHSNGTNLRVTEEKIIIPVDNETLTRTECVSVFRDGSRWVLTWLNRNKNAIQFYDLASGALLKKMTMPSEGPNGIGTIEGYLVKSPDSLYIGSRIYSKLYLVNGWSQILQVIDYGYDQDGEYILPARINNGSLKRPEFVGDKLYLPDIAMGNWQAMTEQQLLGTKLCIEVDTTTGRVKRLPFTYPPNYWAEGKREPVYSRIHENGKFIYSFFGDHYIYVTADHVHVERHPAKSRYFNTLGIYPNSMGMNEYLRYICQYGHYASIVYDKWRRVYYRFVYLPSEVQLDDDLMQKAYNPETISIIILDDRFEVLGETRLPKNRFIIDNFFVTEQGLYVSNHHIENKAVDDDHLSFTLLRLEQTE
jgi:hypothetical protein